MQDEENEAHNHPKLKKFRQKKREVQCAMNLVQKLQHYIDLNGDAEVRLIFAVVCFTAKSVLYVLCIRRNTNACCVLKHKRSLFVFFLYFFLGLQSHVCRGAEGAKRESVRQHSRW